jgi:hypothetical protein
MDFEEMDRILQHLLVGIWDVPQSSHLLTIIDQLEKEHRGIAGVEIAEEEGAV